MQSTQPTCTGIEVTDPAAYRKRFAQLLGDKNPIAVIGDTPGKARELFDGVPNEQLQRRPYADRWTWTPKEVLGHLIDADYGFGFRIRSVLCDHRPALTAYDQDRWVAAQQHNQRDPADLLRSFTELRRLNVDLWRRIQPDQLDRVGIHAERGEESLGTMLTMHAGHDLHHLEQIQKYLAAIRRD